jgi:hypothetical protein
VRSAGAHRKSRKIRHKGRHGVPSRVRRTTTIISVAVPTVALAGTFAAYQLQPQHSDPIASSVASYNMHALLAGSAVIDANGAYRLDQPVANPGSPEATKPKPSSSASPAAAAPTTPAPSPAALTCGTAGGTGMLPANYATIVDFLITHGYTKMAAVGIAGNIYQESEGNPESVGTGGGGLIGWTPLPAGFVTGNPAADLQTQLTALLSYNQQWAQYLPALNAATSATQAADIYMNYFERPGIPAAANREGAANAVAQACGFG